MNLRNSNKKRREMMAIGLIVMSFVLYFIMPLNLCLPYSAPVKAAITGTMMVVSEVIFWVGGLMIGREVALRIKKKFGIKSLITCIRGVRKEN